MVILRHVLDLEIFNDDDVVFLHQLIRYLMQIVIALIRDAAHIAVLGDIRFLPVAIVKQAFCAKNLFVGVLLRLNQSQMTALG